jgi:hypothetical protein
LEVKEASKGRTGEEGWVKGTASSHCVKSGKARQATLNEISDNSY